MRLACRRASEQNCSFTRVQSLVFYDGADVLGDGVNAKMLE